MPVDVEVDTVLFEMDGTLIDSTPALNATWEEFAKQYNLDINYVVRYYAKVHTASLFTWPSHSGKP